MTTHLLREAYTLNQIINDRVISYPLKYEKQTNNWKFCYESCHSRRFQIHLIVYTLLVLLAIFLGGSLLYVVAFHREILKPLQMLAGLLIFFTTFNGFVTDSIVVAFGKDIAACINATFRFVETWPIQNKGLKYFKSNSVF